MQNLAQRPKSAILCIFTDLILILTSASLPEEKRMQVNYRHHKLSKQQCTPMRKTTQGTNIFCKSLVKRTLEWNLISSVKPRRNILSLHCFPLRKRYKPCPYQELAPCTSETTQDGNLPLQNYFWLLWPNSDFGGCCKHNCPDYLEQCFNNSAFFGI